MESPNAPRPSANSFPSAAATIEAKTPNQRLGMERGYSLSPMYNLIIEYNKENGENLSTAAEVSWILQNPNLHPNDFEHRSGNGVDPYTCIALKPTRLNRILRAVTELQTFLDRMAQMIEERSNVFKIDPEDTMTAALRGGESRSQLEVAYAILSKRLRIAQQTVMKYEAEYQRIEVPLSPISTAPDLYQDFSRLDSVDDRMRYMLQNIPHHQQQLTAESLDALNRRQAWSVVHPTAPIPVQESTPLTSGPEDQSKLITLSQTEPGGSEDRDRWPTTSQWDDSDMFPAQGRNEAKGPELSFGFQTPFRTGKAFFDISNISQPTSYFSTPGFKSIPDVTIGLATPSRTQLGDNVRQESNANSTSKAVMLVRKATQNNDIPANRDANPRPYSSGGFVPNGGAPINPGAPLGRPSPTGEPSNGGGGGPSGGGGGGGPPNNGGGGPPYGGGGGGRPNPYSYGGGGDPGDNGPPNPGGNGGGPPAPYGMFPANIKTELKIEQLPEWDGNHWTAINYFWQVQQLAFLGGWLPEALGYWLWFRLKEGSGVRNWFVTLPMTHQAFMRSHYLKFLKGIKDGFLGNKWQLKMNNYYNNQTFRERNHEKESPADFITRRIVYTRMLLSVDVGGPLEVFYIMRKAPVSWGPILLLSSIKDSSELYSRVTEHEEALLEAYRVSKGGVPNSLDSIVTQLRQLGFVQERPPYRRQANVVENSNIPSFST